MSALFDLSGCTALITGSSRGLGFAFAEALVAHGAKIVLNGTNAGTLQAAADALRKKGYGVDSAAFDVSDEDSVGNAFSIPI